MFKRTGRWFNNLSKAGKIGFVSASAFCLLAASSVLAGPNNDQPQRGKTKSSCSASTKAVTQTVAIPFSKTQTNDPNIDRGTSAVTTTGVDGEKTVTSEATEYSPAGCKPNTTKFVKEEITKQPVNEVTSIGAKQPATTSSTQLANHNCNPYYSPCLPIVGDLNCRDVGMRVSVHGGDPYNLDADNDGVGCESY